MRWSPLLTAAALGFASACAPPPDQPPEARPEVILHGVHMRAYKGSVLSATGHATRLLYERSSSNADLEQAVLQLPARPPQGKGHYSNLGRVDIVTQRAEGNLNAQKVEASGGVVARTEGGMVARTDRAQFDGQQFLTTGDGPLSVRAPNYALDSVGFSLRSREEEFEFGGPLKSGVKEGHQ